MPLKLLVAIDDNRRMEAQRAKEQRRRDEIRRLEEEAAKRKARKERKIRRPRERREELFQTAEHWRRVQTLREFIEAVRIAATKHSGAAPLSPETMRWLEWANDVANRSDPLKRVRRRSHKDETQAEVNHAA